MEIEVVKTIGFGPTKLAAFDDALQDVELHDVNLIPLSSVIPPGSSVISNNGISVPHSKPYQIGDKAYVVIAHHETDRIGAVVSAGLMWTLNNEDGGLFAESHGEFGSSVPKALLARTMNNMLVRRGLESRLLVESKEPGVDYAVISNNCFDSPVSALVAAIFKFEGWD